MGIDNIRDLKEACANFKCLYDVFSAYTDSKECGDIIKDLNTIDAIRVFADQNDIKESDMEEWIDAYLNDSVNCRVFQECWLYSGVWPTVEIKCLDMIFYVNWVI